MKRTPRAIDEARDAEVPVESALSRSRVFGRLRLALVEQPRSDHLIDAHSGEHRLDDSRLGIQAAKERLEIAAFGLGEKIAFVQNDHVGELDLLREKVGERPIVEGVDGQTELTEFAPPLIVIEEVPTVDDSDHRIDRRDGPEELAARLFLIERHRDREWLGNTGGLDDQMIEAAEAGQLGHFGDELVTQIAANAAVVKLDEALAGPCQGRSTGLDLHRIDVHFGQVIDQNCEASSCRVCKEIVD